MQISEVLPMTARHLTEDHSEDHSEDHAEDDDLISSLRQGHQRSNIVSLNLPSFDTDLEKKLATLFSSAQNNHNYNYSTGFDPAQTLFMRKLFSPSLIAHAIKAIKADYFKVSLYLDFFSQFIVRGEDIFTQIKQKTDYLERIDPFLDMNLELTIRCCGLEYLSEYRPLAGRDRRRMDYGDSSGGSLEYAFLRRLDPVHEAAASILVEQFSVPEMKARLLKAASVNDVLALALIDMNLTFYRSQSDEQRYTILLQDITAMLDGGEYLKAAHLSMDHVAQSVSRQPLSQYIATMEPTRY